MSIFKPDLLAGKHAFCVGATSGINLTIAERFRAAGAKLFVVSRTESKVIDAVRLLGAGDMADGATADVRDFAAIERAVAQSVARFGPIDIVLSGAAGNFLAPAADLSPNGFRTVLEIDLLGGFHVMKAAYPHLRRPGASIVNISALQAFVALPGQAHACAAKAGLDALVRSLALEWGPEGIRVNSIAPGPVANTEGMARLAPTAEAVAALTAAIPLARWASKDEIADLAMFLASPAAANISGTVMVTDGGYLAGRRD